MHSSANLRTVPDLGRILYLKYFNPLNPVVLKFSPGPPPLVYAGFYSNHNCNLGAFNF